MPLPSISFRHVRLATPIALITLAGPALAEMTLTSSDIVDGQMMAIDQVFVGFGCEGGNMAPQLSWSGAPEGTGSFVVTAYDPDAPSGSGWWHWSVVDIPANVTELPEGTGTKGEPLPDGTIQVRNDFSQNAYGGACPPEGAAPHRYVFTVYAMPQESLGIDETASGALVGFYANTSSLGQASITALYGR